MQNTRSARRPANACVPAASLLSAVALVLATALTAQAGALLVNALDPNDDSGGCGDRTNPCNDIQTAIDNSAPGGKIVVRPGVYTEPVLIDVEGLSIKGAGPTGSVIIDTEIAPAPSCEGDDTRTVFAGAGGSGGSGSGPCRQFDGSDQNTCEVAWAISNNDQAVSCFWDAGSNTCEGCGSNNAGSGACTNTCIACDDDPTRTVAAGGSASGACRQFDAIDQSTCEMAWAVSNQGYAVSCFWDAGSNTCEGCDPSNADDGSCRNTCNQASSLEINAADVTLRKLFVRNGKDDGIFVNVGGTGAELSVMKVSGADDDCIGIIADNVEVSKTTIYGCGDSAIDASRRDPDTDDILLAGLVVARNTISLCDDGCVEIEANDSHVVSNRVRNSEDGDCIDIDGIGNVVSGNDVSNCDGNAIYLRGDQFLISRNTVFSTQDDGIAVDCEPFCTGARIADNVVRDIPDDASCFDLLAETAGLVVEGNEALRCADNGFRVFGTGIVLRDNLAEETGGDDYEAGFDIEDNAHVLENNVSRGNHGEGFEISGTGHQFTGNTAEGNTEDGFDVESGADSVMLSGNTATGNNGVGVEISSGANATTVMGNTASGNGADFCDDGTSTSESGNSFATTTSPCRIGD